MLRLVIEAGKNIVDISFIAEDTLKLDELAKKKGVTAVVDMGVTPRMSHMIVGYVDSLFKEVLSCMGVHRNRNRLLTLFTMLF